jgi:hypothetical protein
MGSFLDRRDDKRLAKDIRNNLVLLFAQHSAQLVPNEKSDYRGRRAFDHAIATVSTPDLRLRFTRVRGEVSIYISLTEPRKWESLDSALLWLELQTGAQSKTYVPGSDYDWEAIDHFLVDNWDRIKAAASARGY